MKIYSPGTISNFISQLAELGYDIVTIEEGTLACGHVFAMAPRSDWYNYEITEVFLNEWSSGCTFRAFSKISKRIASELAKV